MSPSMPAEPPREPTIADVLTELQEFKADVDGRFEQVDQRLEKMDYKFDTYETASDKLVRLATTIIVAAATVAVLPSALQAIGPLLTPMVTSGQ
jgi:ABC-type transporter Mla subunit MlaD